VYGRKSTRQRGFGETNKDDFYGMLLLIAFGSVAGAVFALGSAVAVSQRMKTGGEPTYAAQSYVGQPSADEMKKRLHGIDVTGQYQEAWIVTLC
jgi:hypothetical protein